MEQRFSVLDRALLCGLAGLFLGVAVPARAAVFTIPKGDVVSLQSAILLANTNGQDDTINLANKGTYTLTSPAPNNIFTEPTGLRAIGADGGRRLTLNGNGSTLQRDPSPGTPFFRLILVGLGSKVTLNGLILINGKSDYGGGIANDQATLTLNNCTLNQNYGYDGGGIYTLGGTLTLSNCTLSQNEAADGGGIYNEAGTLTLSNSTLYGNYGVLGGGIYNRGSIPYLSNGSLTLSNCTLSLNRGNYGTGIYNDFARVEVGNTILDDGLGEFYNDGGAILSKGFNLSRRGGGGYLTAIGDRINTDPELSLLGLRDNGGPTPTIGLQSTSPAIDNGKDLSGTKRDQRGKPRPVDLSIKPNTLGGDGSDIGAFEVQHLPLSASTVSHGVTYQTTNVRIPVEDKKFANNGPSSEWVTLSGSLHVVAKVAIPTDPTIPGDPIFAVAQIHTNLAGVKGIGATTGGKYIATGSVKYETQVRLPGVLAFNGNYRLVPPNPIKGDGFDLPLQLAMTLSATGEITEATAPPTSPDLVGWWQGEGDATDSIGGSVGDSYNVTFVPGKVGQAFHFNGSGSLWAPNSPALEPATVTTTAWVRASGSPGVLTYLLSKGAVDCFAAPYALYTGDSGGLTFYVSNGADYRESPDIGPGIWDGQWHHVAGTYDGGVVRLYVDGAEVGSGTPTPFTSIDYSLSTSRDLFIGSYGNTCARSFTGDLDEVQVYNRALGAGDIQALHNATK